MADSDVEEKADSMIESIEGGGRYFHERRGGSLVGWQRVLTRGCRIQRVEVTS